MPAQDEDQGIVRRLAMALENGSRHPVGRTPLNVASGEALIDPVGGKNQQITRTNRQHARLDRRQAITHDPAAIGQILFAAGPAPGCPEQNALDIADARPGERCARRLQRRQGKGGTACCLQGFVAELEQDIHRLAGLFAQGPERDPGGGGGFIAVPETIDDGDQNPFATGADQRRIARLPLATHGSPGHRILADLKQMPLERYIFHLVIVTVVPLPISEARSNSSISRFEPGKPRPRLPEVL